MDYRSLMARAALVSLALLSVAGAARAQGGTAGAPLVEDRQVMAHCLCAETRYESLNTDVQTQRSLYDDARGRSDALDHELETDRSNVQTSDPNAVAAFRQKSAAKQALDADIRDRLAPQFNQAVGRYNAAVADYDKQCKGLTYNATILAEVKSGLVCTAPIGPTPN